MEFLPPFANDEVKSIFRSLQEAQIKFRNLCSEETLILEKRDDLEQTVLNVADELANYQLMVLLHPLSFRYQFS